MMGTVRKGAKRAAQGGAALFPCEPNHVLVVDDDQGIRELFRVVLLQGLAGKHVDMAANGAEAVECFRLRRHGVVLLDLHMPVMDGYTAFRRIEALCEDLRWRMPSVVFCTGFAPPDTLDSLLAASDRHFLLNKPVSPDRLVEVVRSRMIE